MKAEFAAAVAAKARGDVMNVRQFCRELDVSPKTFYKYVARFGADGVEGLFPRSRRPRRFPTMLDAAAEDVLVAVRKELAGAGWDYGAQSILFWLADHLDRWPACQPLPARSTINRVLARRGQLVPAPRRRPRRTCRRFQAAHPNSCWQMDGFEWHLADGTPVVVVHVIDDCSRMDLACHVAASENGPDVWTAFTRAAATYGLPAQLLTDNGGAFSGRRRGWSSLLETNTLTLSIKHVPSSVNHPQTCGKVERAHATAEQWLENQPLPQTIAELQTSLDEGYRMYYNTVRRHVSLGGLTPAQHYALGPLDHPAAQPLDAPLYVTENTVSAAGCIGVDGTLIGVGKRHKGHTATVFRNADDVAVFIDNHLSRQLTLDRTRHYQPATPVVLPKSRDIPRYRCPET